MKKVIIFLILQLWVNTLFSQTWNLPNSRKNTRLSIFVSNNLDDVIMQSLPSIILEQKNLTKYIHTLKLFLSI